jgi:hypothetical protein
MLFLKLGKNPAVSIRRDQEILSPMTKRAKMRAIVPSETWDKSFKSVRLGIAGYSTR